MGIKGVGMAGLAVIARQMGKTVTGSDVQQEFITDKVLKAQGISVLPDFDPKRVEGVDLVIATGAHGGKTNIEAQHALELNVPVLMQAEALGLFSKGKKVIAVSGSHGKTTTSAMLAWVLLKAGLDPGFSVGTSEITGLGLAARYGQGDYFVIEADEYMTCPVTDPTPRFLYLKPYITIVTNIEHDHPDRYKTVADVKDAFAQLLKNTSHDGLIIADTDNGHVRDILSRQRLKTRVVTYGEGAGVDEQVTDIAHEGISTSWTVKSAGTTSKPYRLHLAGRHNANNATAAVLAAQATGAQTEAIRAALDSFQGLKRRFEHAGERNGVSVYDDYAHHPTEIKATLRAAKESFPGRRIVAIFQAHTYSRTKSLLNEFCRAFGDADEVIIPEIFPSAREKDDLGMTGQALADGIAQTHTTVHFIPTRTEILKYLRTNALAGDVIFTIGAGDVYHIGIEFLNS